MAPRPYWKGYLKLSLVSCPVVLFPATSLAERTHFHQINKKTGNRLHQQMVDAETGDVVEKDEKGRGYELSKGKYVEIDADELAAVEIESTHTVDIDSFVPADEIDQRYRDKSYYVVPDGKSAEEAFAVIRDAMRDKDKVALARIVLVHREHVIAIEPFDQGMLGTTLRYDYEVRGEKEYFRHIPRARVTKEMIELAEHILDTKTGHFDPSKFKDEYEGALRKLVKRKAAGKPIEAAPEKPASNVINLMDALRQSVGGRKGSNARRAPARKAASKRRSRKPARQKRRA